MIQTNKNLLLCILLTLFFFIKPSLTHNEVEKYNKVIYNNNALPIHYISEEEKKKIKEQLDDLAFISGGGGHTISDFSNFYNQLTPLEKEYYDTIVAASKEPVPSLEITITYDDSKNKLDMDEFGDELLSLSINVFSIIIMEHPELWWIGWFTYYYYYYYNSYIHEITYNMIRDDETSRFREYNAQSIASINKKIEMVKNDIMEKISKLNLTTDYAIIRYIHDYLIIRNTYLLDESRLHIRSLYGSMVENTCVCAGYAEAFQYMAQQYNIECIKGLSMTHEWNYVKLNNNWYVMDLTWDDHYTYEKGTNAVISGPTGYGFDQDIRTDYFLAGTEYVEKNESDGEHSLVYFYYIGYTCFDFPPISESRYIPTEEEEEEVLRMRESFAESYLSVTSCNKYFQ